MLDGILMIMEIKITDLEDWSDTTVKADSKDSLALLSLTRPTRERLHKSGSLCRCETSG